MYKVYVCSTFCLFFVLLTILLNLAHVLYRVCKAFKEIVVLQDLTGAKEKLVQLAQWLVIDYNYPVNCL